MLLRDQGQSALYVARPLPNFAAEGHYVRVHPELPKATVFIGVENGGRFLPVGTGFLAAFKKDGFDCTFIVTADHVIEMIRGDTFSIRLNRHSGEASTIQVPKSKVFRPQDRALDIAMIGIAPDWTIFDQKVILLDRKHHEHMLDTVWRPDIGDEVATVGLYSSHFGETKNLPVVRVGNIAMMPGEPVLTHRGYVSAYLIEVKSIAGLSGSPVHINPPTVRVKDGEFNFLNTDVAIPLGMLTGYHIVASAADQIEVPKIQGEDLPERDEDGAPIDERNTGFAVVVPWERLLDLIESDTLQKDADMAIANHLKSANYRPASVSPPAEETSPRPTDANPTHREDFMRLVGAAARKHESKD